MLIKIIDLKNVKLHAQELKIFRLLFIALSEVTFKPNVRSSMIFFDLRSGFQFDDTGSIYSFNWN